LRLPEIQLPEAKGLPELDDALWDQVFDPIRDRVQTLRDTLAQKFPFGIVTALTSVNFTEGAANCAFTFPVGPVQGHINICETPFWQMAATFRPLLAALFWLSLAFVLVRRALDVSS
jgi:hypothetical protein